MTEWEEIRVKDGLLRWRYDRDTFLYLLAGISSLWEVIEHHAHLYLIPAPTETIFIVPESAYEIGDCVLQGQRIPPPHCTLYLVFYSRQSHELLLVVPETDQEVRFPSPFSLT